MGAAQIQAVWRVSNHGVEMAGAWLRLVLWAAVSLTTSVAAAQGTAPSSTDALALVDRWGFDAKFDREVPTCVRPQGTQLDPRSALEINSNYFGGIQPGTSEWTEIEVIYQRIRRVTCGGDVQRRWKGLLAAKLGAHFLGTDIKAALADESSKEAKRIGETLNQLEPTLWPSVNQFMVVAIELARQEFQPEINAVIQRARSR